MAMATQTAETEPQSAMLVAGSIHYASGEFERAVTCFCRYVHERVDDVDAWTLLAAALRRSGRFPEADAIVFRLLEVIERARQIGCDVTWLREYC
jgi:Flp pilus assembly protein TadD